VLLLPHALFRREGEVSSLASALAGRLGYFILDEAHLASNSASALAYGVKALAGVAGHRLALTGTPVQNGVHELWTAFDWLIPGYLGEEGAFRKGTTAVIARARGANASAQDVRAARVVLRSLHRSLLPFILRRLKCDVLTDLPPRTIVDVLVKLAPAQRTLYDAFTARVGTAWAHAAVRSVDEEGEEKEGAGAGAEAAAPAVAPHAREAGQPSVNALSAITTLRQICGHPRLVTDGTLLGAVARSERDGTFPVHESCKLIGLLQLLQQLGVAISAVEEGEEGEQNGPKRKRQRKEGGGSGAASEEGKAVEAEQGPVLLTPSLSVDARKLLVFSQSTRMLDAVEYMMRSTPGISRVGFCRMDGSTPGPARPALAASFNTDPSMRLLLLTTGVGGLGLSLVGADTVVFLDHDWNPSRDLQAMDRAHRIGQTRPVTVYRLLAKGTLEERIMGVQRFKTGVAGVVVGGAGAGGSSVLEGAWGGGRQEEGGAEVEEDAAAFFAARRAAKGSSGSKRKNDGRGGEQ
jgi:TATA-binding protein-associated factor